MRIGDLVLTPDDEIGTVVYFAHNGEVAVETPWSAQWVRYTSDQLRPVTP